MPDMFFDAREYGLSVDGDPVENGKALNRAIAAASEAGGGTVSLLNVVGARIQVGTEQEG